MTIDAQRRWYAVQVKPRHEKTVAELMRGRGFEEFLPLYTSQRRWSDRLKLVALPLFPRYTFCRFGEGEQPLILRVPGVRSIVGFKDRAIPVEEAEIEAVRALLDSRLPLSRLRTGRIGQHVRVVEGPLTGCEGVVEKFKSIHRLVVTVSLLGRSVAVEIDPSWVIVLHSSEPPGRGSGTKVRAAARNRLQRFRG